MQFTQPTSAIVVGAGVGGLAAAIRLAAAGARVTVFEAAEGPGGKARAARLDDGAPVDTGPTVVTLPDVFESLFAAAGARLSDRVTLRRADLLARHFWPDGTRFDLFAEPSAARAEVAAVFGEAEAAGFDRFRAHAEALLRIVDAPFMRGQRPTVLGTLRSFGVRALPDLLRIDGLRALDAALADFFKTPHLRQLFGRYATYVGSDAHRAPATLAVIAGVEMAGVYQVEGGVGRLVGALAELAAELGVEFVYNAAVEAVEVEAGRACGVRVAGASHRADAVAIAADAGAVAEGRFGPAAADALPRPTGARSLSALTFSGRVVAWPQAPALSHHTVFFSADAGAERRALFERGQVPTDGTLYLCAQDRPASREAPPAGGPGRPERLLALLNASALAEPHDDAPRGDTGDAPWTEAKAEALLSSRLRSLGLTPAPGTARINTPASFAALYPGSAGALYGRASHGWRQAFLRPQARTRLPGLYLCGGTVHPGAGLPMAALSGCRAAEALWADRPSTSSSPAGATPGGTRTWSLPTAGTP